MKKMKFVRQLLAFKLFGLHWRIIFTGFVRFLLDFNEGDGGILSFLWLTLTWNWCVCNDFGQAWLYCSYHEKPLPSRIKE